MANALLMLTMVFAVAAPCRAEQAPRELFSSLPTAPQTIVNPDPLMSQIFHRQLTQKNGGVTAVVRVATGQSVELQIPELDMSLAGSPMPPQTATAETAKGLSIHPDLESKTRIKPSKRRSAKVASQQLKSVEKKGWDDRAKPSGNHSKRPELD